MSTNEVRMNDAAETQRCDKLVDNEVKSLEYNPDTAVDNVASSFSKLFAVDPTTQLNDLEVLVDNLLAYSGECCSVTDQIREESNKLLFISMPQFYEKRDSMRIMFRQIDALEEFIKVIKNNVDELEQSVQIGEKQLGNKNLKKIISSIPIPSFFSKKQNESSTKTDAKDSKPQIPSIFKTDNYLYGIDNSFDNSRDSPSFEKIET